MLKLWGCSKVAKGALGKSLATQIEGVIEEHIKYMGHVSKMMTGVLTNAGL